MMLPSQKLSMRILSIIFCLFCCLPVCANALAASATTSAEEPLPIYPEIQKSFEIAENPDDFAEETATKTDFVETSVEKISVLFSGDAYTLTEDEAVYTISLENIKQPLIASFWIEIDGNYLAEKELTALGGFKLIGDIKWEELSDNLLSGHIVIAISDEIAEGTSHYTDILTMIFSTSSKPGETTVTLTGIELSGYDDVTDIELFYQTNIETHTVNTEILSSYLIYDINKDGELNQLDLTLAQVYYTAKEGDENWDEAKMADVNQDGRVDIEDLILIPNYVDWNDNLDSTNQANFNASDNNTGSDIPDIENSVDISDDDVISEVSGSASSDISGNNIISDISPDSSDFATAENSGNEEHASTIDTTNLA